MWTTLAGSCSEGSDRMTIGKPSEHSSAFVMHHMMPNWGDPSQSFVRCVAEKVKLDCHLLRYEVYPIFINDKLRKYQFYINEKVWNCKG